MLIPTAGLVLTASPAMAQERAGLLERMDEFFGGGIDAESLDAFPVADGQAAAVEIFRRQQRLDVSCLA